MTKDAIIASNMARRNFDETTSIVIDELKTQEAKRYYCKMILMCITAKMSHACTDTFEEDVNDVIEHINEQCLKG